MTNPGESDEWWKQYGGSGVSSDPAAGAGRPPTGGEPSSYPSAPPYPSAPATPSTPPMAPGPPSYSAAPPSTPYQGTPNYSPYGAAGAGYQAGYQPYGYPANRGTNGLAIASLVTSLAGFATCGLTSIVGIILGVIALNQIRDSGQEGRGMALAGIWAGVGLIALAVIWIVVMVIAGMASA
ncbi:DUF4190 domain-containing protein [Nocardia sp. NBC_00416]|uniref:DUF4190 domain-containing protein n=1 Tax=Nocardia sp. NBC_00416 TaxID=2975991 RepID=UPI002E233267